MRRRSSFLILVFCGLMAGSCLAQKKWGTYRELQIPSLSPVSPVQPEALDSFEFYIRMPSENASRFVLARNGTKEKRSARLVTKPYGKLIAFDIIKVPVFEKVLIFGDREALYDSVLVRKDTLIGKFIDRDRIMVRLTWKAGEDSFLMKEFVKNYGRSNESPFSYPIDLWNYGAYFSTQYYDEARLFTIVRKPEGFRLAKAEPLKGKIENWQYKFYENDFRKYGYSLFLMTVCRVSTN